MYRVTEFLTATTENDIAIANAMGTFPFMTRDTYTKSLKSAKELVAYLCRADNFSFATATPMKYEECLQQYVPNWEAGTYTYSRGKWTEDK